MKKSWHEHRRIAPVALRTSREGIVFHSKTELMRWEHLKLRERIGEIIGLERQIKFELYFYETGPCGEPERVNIMAGKKIACYTADFRYSLKNGKTVIEDVKAYRDEQSKFRIRVAEALHSMNVTIVMLKSNRWVIV